MNMYDMMRRFFDHQSYDEQNLANIYHRRSSWFDDDDDDHNKKNTYQRRRSSFTGYELNYFKDKSVPKSTTMINNRLSISKPRTSVGEQSLLNRNTNLSQRRSTIHRLNSSTSNDSNIVRIQSNEYTSITDGLKSFSFVFVCFFFLTSCFFFVI